MPLVANHSRQSWLLWWRLVIAEALSPRPENLLWVIFWLPQGEDFGIQTMPWLPYASDAAYAEFEFDSVLQFLFRFLHMFSNICHSSL